MKQPYPGERCFRSCLAGRQTYVVIGADIRPVGARAEWAKTSDVADKEYRARLRASRISTGLFVRFVALLVRFTGSASTVTFRAATCGGGCSVNASVSGRLGMEEGVGSQHSFS